MSPAAANELGPVLVALLRGVVSRDLDPALWQALETHAPRVRDWVALVGLDLHLDESEGYAFLRQRPPPEEGPAMPRLVARRPLGYGVSLLLVLLRKRLAETDARGDESRLILSLDQMAELLRTFLPADSDEARTTDRVQTHVNKLVELGFLRKLPGGETYEVRRILKAFVDAPWLGDLEARLAAYRAHAESVARDEDVP